MKKILQLLFMTLLFTSCGQEYNSNFNDRGTYADIGISASDPLYQPYIILQTKCFNCHGSEWSQFKNSQQWVDAGLVIRKSFATSLLKTRLRNFGGNMPPDPYSPLTALELETVKNWINSL